MSPSGAASVNRAARKLAPATALSNNHAVASGYVRNIGIAYGRRAPDGAAAREYRAMLEHVIRRNPKGVGLITVLDPESTPTTAGREIILKMFKDLWPNLLGAAFVVTAQGFAAAVQRSAIAGSLMALRLTSHVRVFSNVESATLWLAPRTLTEDIGTHSSDFARELADVVQEFCKRHDEASIRT